MSLDTVFTICASVGGVLFLVQLVLQFVIGHHDHGSASFDTHDPTGHVSADVSFKVISLQGLSSFLLMFGLVGLATWRALSGDAVRSPLLAIACGMLGGAATTWVIAKIFRMASKLQSSGTLNPQALVGAEGTVTLAINSEKPGKANLTIGARMLELEAVTSNGEPLETGALVRVTRLVGDHVVAVEKSRT